jgi:Ser/Thr protein kinase RdoA (MazF antagonist)
VDDAGRGARGRKPVLTPAIAHAVRRTWGVELGDAADLGGSTGLNLRAATDGSPVVVRVHRPHVTGPRVEALQLAREAAATGGVPVARAILGHDGQRVAVATGCVIEVEEFVDSDATMDSLPRIRAAIAMLGRLHDALATAELPHAADELSFANYLSAGEVATKTPNGVARIRALDPALREAADLSEALADELATAHRRLAPLPTQWCHGDFWDNNVLFRTGDIVLVTDFGFMNRRPRIDDLALTLYFTLGELDPAGHGEPARVLAGLTDAYDSGTRRPLSPAERHALPLALARQPLWSIAVWATQLDDPDTVAAHLDGHELALTRARTILDDIDHWIEAFRGS